MVEPGLDRHEWESEWAALEENFDGEPAGSLSAVHELMTRMLRERNILDDDLVAVEGADPELIRPWVAARDLVQRLDAELDVEETDVREALEGYRELFQTLLEDRRPV
jgi:hypothetical protein